MPYCPHLFTSQGLGAWTFCVDVVVINILNIHKKQTQYNKFELSMAWGISGRSAYFPDLGLGFTSHLDDNSAV